MGEFVRSASSTVEAPVIRKLKSEFPGGAPGAAAPAAQRPAQAPGAPRPGAPRPGAPGPRPGNNPFSAGGSTGMQRPGGPRPGNNPFTAGGNSGMARPGAPAAGPAGPRPGAP